MTQRTIRSALGISLALNLLLLPLLVNSHLRFTYRQTIAHWQSKLFAPNVVFIGDSITAGGRSFNDGSGINLGSNGLQTFQVAALLGKAIEYRPKYIVVMAGTNDAIAGPINQDELRGLWSQICADPRVVVTLAPPSRNIQTTARVGEASSIARETCARLGRPVISLNVLSGPDGLLQAQYTTDGTHLNEAAYRVWRDKLSTLGI